MIWGALGSHSDDSDALAIIGVLLATASVHALALSSLVAVGLLATERASLFRTTLLNAVLGGATAIPVLAHIYFNVGA